MTENKVVRLAMDAATITGLMAGYDWLAKKIIKEPMTGDPSSSFMNYVKLTAVVMGSLATKSYLEDQKSLPKSI